MSVPLHFSELSPFDVLDSWTVLIAKEDRSMRKPRDYDAELKALDDRAKQLKTRKVQQLGELVVACGADSLSPEHLAGALLGIAEVEDAGTKEGWRKRGAAFFQGSPRKAASNPGNKPEGTLPL